MNSAIHTIPPALFLFVSVLSSSEGLAQGVKSSRSDFVGGPVTSSFQPGDGNWPHSEIADWRLIESSPDLTGTPWASTVVVGRSPFPGDDGEHRWLVSFPGAVGHEAGQIPILAQVLEATIEVYAVGDAGSPVAVRGVTEDHLGQTGRLFGQDSTRAPSWNSRFPELTWTVPGAGWPGSSSAPLDEQSAGEGDGWLSFDITAAVQGWVDEPTSNHGLLFTATDLDAPAQGFAGGSAHDSLLPILTVTWFTGVDLVPPEIEITTETTSPVRVAFVEGTVTPDAISVEFRRGEGPWHDAKRQSGTTWYARVELEAESATTFDVRATDAAGNEEIETQLITWQVIDPLVASPLLLARDEAVLFAPPALDPAVHSVDIETGDALPFPVLAYPGYPREVSYHYPGEFVTRFVGRDEDGQVVEVHTLAVTVIDVAAKRAIADQVGFPRGMDFELEPLDRVDSIAMVAADPWRLRVSDLHVDEDELLATLLPTMLGSPLLQVRLGGPTGRVIYEEPVHAFLIQHKELTGLSLNGEVEMRTRIVPPMVLRKVPFLEFEAKLFSDGARFPENLDLDQDGLMRFGVGAFDEGGMLTLPAIHDPDLAAEFCRSLSAFNPNEFPISLATGHNAAVCGAKVVVEDYPAYAGSEISFTLEGTGDLDYIYDSSWTIEDTGLVSSYVSTGSGTAGTAAYQILATETSPVTRSGSFEFDWGGLGQYGDDETIDFEMEVEDGTYRVRVSPLNSYDTTAIGKSLKAEASLDLVPKNSDWSCSLPLSDYSGEDVTITTNRAGMHTVTGTDVDDATNTDTQTFYVVGCFVPGMNDKVLVGVGGTVDLPSVGEPTGGDFTWTVTGGTAYSFVGGTGSSSQDISLQFDEPGHYFVDVSYLHSSVSSPSSKYPESEGSTLDSDRVEIVAVDYEVEEVTRLDPERRSTRFLELKPLPPTISLSDIGFSVPDPAPGKVAANLDLQGGRIEITDLLQQDLLTPFEDVVVLDIDPLLPSLPSTSKQIGLWKYYLPIGNNAIEAMKDEGTDKAVDLSSALGMMVNMDLQNLMADHGPIFKDANMFVKKIRDRYIDEIEPMIVGAHVYPFPNLEIKEGDGWSIDAALDLDFKGVTVHMPGLGTSLNDDTLPWILKNGLKADLVHFVGGSAAIAARNEGTVYVPKVGHIMYDCTLLFGVRSHVKYKDLAGKEHKGYTDYLVGVGLLLHY